MKKFKKVFLYIALAIVVIIITTVSLITLALPDVGKPEKIAIALTPQRIARGEYLANHVALCTDCHSRRNWSLFAAPTSGSAPGGGGEVFDASVGFPGEVRVPNITPYNLKNWTDGEIFRAITCGVRKDGGAIFPLMPWPYYSKMSREDIYSIIAYLRTLKPVQSSYGKSRLNFPLNILVHTMPQKASLGTIPPVDNKVRYGAYLVQSAACRDCHSQSKNGKLLAGLEFAGGHEYTVNGNILRSSNITPDKATGIGTWSQEMFVQRFKGFNNPAKATKVSKIDFQTIMPWYDYGGMTENDLKAIYTYLRTVKPVNNTVTKFTANSLASN